MLAAIDEDMAAKMTASDSEVLVEQLRSEVDYLREELRKSREELEQGRERSDTIILQLTRQLENQQKLLEYRRSPFWKRWFRREREADES